MDGFYRTHLFAGCRKCNRGGGLVCQDEYASLKPGYWWQWRNESYRQRYQDFIQNLLASLPALDNFSVQYPHAIPAAYRCPIEKSCKGGLDSPCGDGYEGPLCAVCSSGYYKQLDSCAKCPSRAWIVAQLSIIALVLFLIFIFLRCKRKATMREDRGQYLIDMFFFQAEDTYWFLSGHTRHTDSFLVHRMARFTPSSRHLFRNTSAESVSDRTPPLSISRVTCGRLWRAALDFNSECHCHWRNKCGLHCV